MSKIFRKNTLVSFVRHSAFTLAEVLITLGIIGILAEMLIPTLMNNIQKQVTVTQLKKAYTVLVQAIKLSEADNGEYSSWTFPSTPNSANTQTFYDTYLKPYLKTIKQCPDGVDFGCGIPISDGGINYALNDGTGMSLVVEPDGSVPLLFDINGPKKPNLMGKDVFYFAISKDNGVQPHGFIKGMTRDQIRNDGSSQCQNPPSGNYRYNCAALIMYDGWVMSSDYPW